MERWLTDAQLVEHFNGAFKERWLRYRRAEGMPYARIAGKPRYKLSEVEPWLELHGYIDRGDVA
jgi:hypothetical protein